MVKKKRIRKKRIKKEVIKEENKKAQLSFLNEFGETIRLQDFLTVNEIWEKEVTRYENRKRSEEN